MEVISLNFRHLINAQGVLGLSLHSVESTAHIPRLISAPLALLQDLSLENTSWQEPEPKQHLSGYNYSHVESHYVRQLIARYLIM